MGAWRRRHPSSLTAEVRCTCSSETPFISTSNYFLPSDISGERDNHIDMHCVGRYRRTEVFLSTSAEYTTPDSDFPPNARLVTVPSLHVFAVSGRSHVSHTLPVSTTRSAAQEADVEYSAPHPVATRRGAISIFKLACPCPGTVLGSVMWQKCVGIKDLSLERDGLEGQRSTSVSLSMDL